ncbi:hypothetical protein M430DRAFT_60099 [Amorphotheca resinae ATCC 22711]|uniref:Uncharacterized protein n=1 Tax=Amorphotheca resinae ATCC 22711 TaxID=857342 RepID=A0A2T3AW57_AMORE|nr:hypothetical protein M430DRAFT_60099 [Amorphotheca resinae ATCC 22711]PSS12912.1 hypothetical protein M430DRAFT_60099 [Amorphotheca resinae ATCC 22711]
MHFGRTKVTPRWSTAESDSVPTVFYLSVTSLSPFHHCNYYKNALDRRILKWKVGNIVENNDVMVLGQQGVWSSEVGAAGVCHGSSTTTPHLIVKSMWMKKLLIEIKKRNILRFSYKCAPVLVILGVVISTPEQALSEKHFDVGAHINFRLHDASISELTHFRSFLRYLALKDVMAPANG